MNITSELELTAALGCEMLETFGYGVIAESLWRIPVRLARSGELLDGALAEYFVDSREIVLAPATVRENEESVLALYLIHEAVHSVDPSCHFLPTRVSKAAAAKSELDADKVAIEVGEKWLEQLKSLGKTEDAQALTKGLNFLRRHYQHHQAIFVSSVFSR